MTTTRHIEETKWFCTDKARCAELDKAIADVTYHTQHLSADVAAGHITGLECLQREAKLTQMTKDFREQRAKLWRRAKRTIDEVIDDDGNVVSSTRRVVAPRAVQDVPEGILAEPSVEGNPLVRIRTLPERG